ncbi:dynein regulatory complex subunit 4-like [Brachionichthys hirsutus]|uniref:dynein regulatory complex subunit 4-like n=1 Tax=Brachionichthys hirsutus TaxID=412623 RepID=UPI00360501CA
MTDQLKSKIASLRKELEAVKKEKQEIQLEKANICAYWEISKRNVEEKRSKLAQSEFERDELKEHHRQELNELEQKMKHLLSEQNDTICSVNMENMASSALIKNEHRLSELRQEAENKALESDFRKMKLHSELFSQEFNQMQQMESQKLANTYETLIDESGGKYHNTRKSLINTAKEKDMAELQSVENTWKKKIETMKEEHERILTKKKEALAHKSKLVMLEQKKLCDKNLKLTQKQSDLDELLSDARKNHPVLQESVKEAQRKLSELQKDEEVHVKNTKERLSAETQLRQSMMKTMLRDLTVEYELLMYDCESAEMRRDELLQEQQRPSRCLKEEMAWTEAQLLREQI